MSKYNITRKLKDFDYTDVVAEETRTGTESLTFSNTHDADFKFMSISLQKDNRDGMHFENTRLNSGAEFEIVDSNGSVKQTFTIPTYLDKGDVYYPIIGKMKRSTGVVQDFTPVQLKQTSGANCTIKFKPKADYSDYALAQDTSFVNTPKVYPLQLCKDSVSIENLSKNSSADWKQSEVGQHGLVIGSMNIDHVKGHLYYQRGRCKYTTTNQTPTQIYLFAQSGYRYLASQDSPVAGTEYFLSGLYIPMTSYITYNKQAIFCMPSTAISGVITYGKESMVIDLTSIVTASGDSFLDILANAGYTTNAQIQAWCDTLPWIDPSTPLVLGKGMNITNIVPNPTFKNNNISYIQRSSLDWANSASNGKLVATRLSITFNNGRLSTGYVSNYLKTLPTDLTSKIYCSMNSDIADHFETLGVSKWNSIFLGLSVFSLKNLSTGFGSRTEQSYNFLYWYIDSTSASVGDVLHLFNPLAVLAQEEGLYSFILLLGHYTDALIKTFLDTYLPFFAGTVQLGGVSEPCITAVAITSQEGFIKE